MEQITKRDGTIYYGSQICEDGNDAYCRFRDDYHASLGKEVYKRLNMPDREERIHGFHIYFSDEVVKMLDAEFGLPDGRIKYRIMGLVGISYCRGIDGDDCPDYDEEKFYRWLDWCLSHSGSMMMRVGTNDKTGRTSKIFRTRYR